MVATVSTDSTGKACVGDLLSGTYSVTETSVPAGYAGDPDTESAVVNAKATCPGGDHCDPPDGTPDAFDDTSEAFKNLKPGTCTCTVVVDP